MNATEAAARSVCITLTPLMRSARYLGLTLRDEGSCGPSASLFPHVFTQPLLCPCHCRELGGMLGKKGWNVIAPDWLGHGNSDKVCTCT